MWGPIIQHFITGPYRMRKKQRPRRVVLTKVAKTYFNLTFIQNCLSISIHMLLLTTVYKRIYKTIPGMITNKEMQRTLRITQHTPTNYTRK